MKTISFYHEAAADFEAKSSLWGLNPDGSPRTAAISLKYGLVSLYYCDSRNGQSSSEYIMQTFGIRQSETEGLQWFDTNTNGWRRFEESVQQAYSDYIADKELLK